MPASAVVVLALVVGVLSGAVGVLVGDASADAEGDVPVVAQVAPADDGPAGSGAVAPAGGVAEVAERVLPSVVSVEVDGDGGSGTGSGVVLSGDGLVLTNNHVVAPADGGPVTVVTNAGVDLAAEVVGRDERSDLAVLRVEADGLRPVELGRSGDLAVGELVIAVGSPLGLTQTVTTGIVSALNRPVRAGGGAEQPTAVIDAIQTDAAINPGNSGGPLLDAAGRVVGINSAIASLGGGPLGGGGNIGVGFAIPIDYARSIADEIIATGSATHPVIGVEARTVDARADDVERDGARVARVVGGGAAEAAGVLEGDVIVAVGEAAVASVDDLIVQLRRVGVGGTTDLTVVRGGDEVTLQVTPDAS